MEWSPRLPNHEMVFLFVLARLHHQRCLIEVAGAHLLVAHVHVIHVIVGRALPLEIGGWPI